MTDQIPGGLLRLLLPEETIISILNDYIASGIQNRVVFGHQIADAQLSYLLKAGYISPEEARQAYKEAMEAVIKIYEAKIEEAKKQAIIEWLTEHKESYYQEPNGGITLIFRACWTLEEWLALKAGKGDEK